MLLSSTKVQKNRSRPKTGLLRKTNVYEYRLLLKFVAFF